MTFTEALREQEETGVLWDECGETESIKMQLLLDGWWRENGAELSGSAHDWEDLRALARQFDELEDA